ncbi:hypothetical protein NL108_005446 [Boleophthalmus pectinirostris]|nr:hypothetical protein NL108_005446 [Boleophthalmus pectinirostris]
MLCSRVVMLVLALHWLMEEISAAALMNRNKRELNLQALETLPQLHLEGELSTGDKVEMERDNNNGPTQIQTPLAPTQQPSTRNQFQYIRKKNEKRRKVIPLDSLGRFKI